MIATSGRYQHLKKLSAKFHNFFLQPAHVNAIKTGCPTLEELVSCNDKDYTFSHPLGNVQFTSFPRGWQCLRSLRLTETVVTLDGIHAMASCSVKLVKLNIGCQTFSDIQSERRGFAGLEEVLKREYPKLTISPWQGFTI